MNVPYSDIGIIMYVCVIFLARDVDAVKNDVRVLALRLLDISSNGTSSSMYVRIVMHITFYTHTYVHS